MTRRVAPQPGVDRMVSPSWSGRRRSAPAARQGRALARGLEGRLPLQHHHASDQNSSSSRCRASFSLALKHGIYRECGKSRQSDSLAACAALESDMTHISGFERSQLLLLPEAIDDHVAADNPVRFIDAFVDGLDLAAAGFKRVTPKVTGRPGYAPGDLLKLYIYGYLSRVRSSRRLEAECHRNIEVIWLLRTLKPDFKTIADFRSDNRAAFRAVFRQFTLLCRE